MEEGQVGGLYMAPGIGEAWVKHIARTRIMHRGQAVVVNRKVAGRPFHETEDGLNVMNKAREIYRKDSSHRKKDIIDRILNDYSRAKECYSRFGIAQWVTEARVAIAKKGRPKKKIT